MWREKITNKHKSSVFMFRFSPCLTIRWRIAHQAGRGRTPAECPEIQHHHIYRPSLVAVEVRATAENLPASTPPSSFRIRRTRSDSAESTDGVPHVPSDPAATCCAFCPAEASMPEAAPMTQTVSLPLFFFLKKCHLNLPPTLVVLFVYLLSYFLWLTTTRNLSAVHTNVYASQKSDFYQSTMGSIQS